jgi:hypothetical protein
MVREWPSKGLRVETEGAFEDRKRQEKYQPEKPSRTRHQEQAKGPPAMGFEIAGHGVAQGHGGEEPYQDCVQGSANVLRYVADGSANPGHVKTSRGDSDGGQHIDTPVPAMKDGKAIPDLRN